MKKQFSIILIIFVIYSAMFGRGFEYLKQDSSTSNHISISCEVYDVFGDSDICDSLQLSLMTSYSGNFSVIHCYAGFNDLYNLLFLYDFVSSRFHIDDINAVELLSDLLRDFHDNKIITILKYENTEFNSEDSSLHYYSDFYLTSTKEMPHTNVRMLNALISSDIKTPASVRNILLKYQDISKYTPINLHSLENKFLDIFPDQKINISSNVEFWNGFTSSMDIESFMIHAQECLKINQFEYKEKKANSFITVSHDFKDNPVCNVIALSSPLSELLQNDAPNIFAYFFNNKLYGLVIYQSADGKKLEKQLKKQWGKPVTFSKYEDNNYPYYYMWESSDLIKYLDFRTNTPNIIYIDNTVRKAWLNKL